MTSLVTLILVYLILSILSETSKSENISLKIPENFLIGAGNSGYQIEGSSKYDGKGESIWDRYIHNFPDIITDKSNAADSSDFYHKYKEDIQLLKDIGFNSYRFSFSWSRLFPSGYNNTVNKKGVRYYHRVLDELKRQGIQAAVTLHHLNHPQNLEEIGGWLNEKMIDIYAAYARFVFKEYGKKVKIFTTFNEPRVMCKLGYEHGLIAPGRKVPGSMSICLHNVLKAHATAYHIYKTEFHYQQGLIGICELCQNYYGRSTNDSTIRDVAFDLSCGLVFNPIYGDRGDYPKVVKRIDSYVKQRNLSHFHLPKFSNKWRNYIKGTGDYIGLNYYVSSTMEYDFGKRSTIDTYLLISQIVNTTWLSTKYLSYTMLPEGFGESLRRIKRKYNNKSVYILENGIGDPAGIQDNLRLNYLYMHMRELLIALKKYGCNIKGYFIWSFLDSFEWHHGYTSHFGLVEVDFKNSNRKRTPKNSTHWLKTVFKNRDLGGPPVNNISLDSATLANRFGINQ